MAIQPIQEKLKLFGNNKNRCFKYNKRSKIFRKYEKFSQVKMLLCYKGLQI